mmetsp:Transcript_46146/g.75039  ORF Transcript_46146/g.75039 Transcript_46146/m.75039 type:complete len:229 (-) Transcript_46146:424-1110(-)
MVHYSSGKDCPSAPLPQRYNHNVTLFLMPTFCKGLARRQTFPTPALVQDDASQRSCPLAAGLVFQALQELLLLKSELASQGCHLQCLLSDAFLVLHLLLNPTSKLPLLTKELDILNLRLDKRLVLFGSFSGSFCFPVCQFLTFKIDLLLISDLILFGYFLDFLLEPDEVFGFLELDSLGFLSLGRCVGLHSFSLFKAPISNFSGCRHRSMDLFSALLPGHLPLSPCFH